MQNTMQYRTCRVTGVSASEKPSWFGQVVLGKTVTVEQVATEVAAILRLDTTDILYVIAKLGEAIAAVLRSGRNVSLDWVTFVITLKGAFPYQDSHFSASVNELTVRAHARPAIRDCLKDVTPKNVTPGLSAAILTVMDNVAMTEGTITVASKVLVGGMGIRIDTANADEGVWLVAKDGTIAATPTVLANDGATMDLDFGELPENGVYTLVVKARTGASTDYAPAVARYTVTIKAS